MSQSFRLAETAQIEALWQSQEGLCALCGKPMLKNRYEARHGRIWAKQRATIDHIHARSKGGSDKVENLQLVHAICNKRKGAQGVG